MNDVVVCSDRVRQLTLEIKEIQEDVCRGMIEIGNRLIEIKKELGHGNWLPYVESELGYSRTAACNLMRVARECVSFDINSISNLKSTAIIELLSLPANTRESFLLQYGQNIESMSIRKLKNAVKSKKSGEQRKPIPVATKKQLAVRSGGKCEVCGKGNEYLVSWLVEHHIVEHCKTQDDSMDNLLMVCPNCHNFIHSLKNTTDTTIKDNLSKGIIEMVGIDTYNEIVKYVD